MKCINSILEKEDKINYIYWEIQKEYNKNPNDINRQLHNDLWYHLFVRLDEELYMRLESNLITNFNKL